MGANRRYGSRVVAGAPGGRRGVAMLMVMICLVVATVMTASALSTQHSAPLIGDNAAEAAAAQWSAESAADLAVAVIEKSSDWVARGDTILDGMMVAGGAITVTVTDLEGNPPTNDTREVLVTAVGKVNGIESRAQKVVSITPPATLRDAIDPHLGEFGVYATRTLELDEDATVARWALSPEARSGRPVAIGTGFISSFSYVVDPAANLSDAMIVPDARASSGLLSAIEATPTTSVKVPAPVPAFAEAMPSGFSSLTVTGLSVVSSTPATPLTVTPARHNGLRIQAGCEAIMDAANGQHYAFVNNLRVESGTLVIKGDIRVVTNNLLVTNGGAIEFADSSSRLTLYFTGLVSVDNATVGLPRAISAISSRTAGDMTQYSNPRRLRILQLVGATTPSVGLTNNALVCGIIHGPLINASINNNSTLMGRLTTGDLRLDSTSSILYCSRLDNRVGFTNRLSPIYRADGTPQLGLVDAINGFNTALGAQALPTTIEAAVTAANTVTAPLGGGRTPVTEGTLSSTFTADSIKRTTSTSLANVAMSLEGKDSFDEYDDDACDN